MESLTDQARANYQARQVYYPPVTGSSMTDGHRTMEATGGFTSPGVTGADVTGRQSSFTENLDPTTDHAAAVLGKPFAVVTDSKVFDGTNVWVAIAIIAVGVVALLVVAGKV